MPTMVCNWLVDGMPFPAETLLECLDNITPPQLFRLIERLAAR